MRERADKFNLAVLRKLVGCLVLLGLSVPAWSRSPSLRGDDDLSAERILQNAAEAQGQRDTKAAKGLAVKMRVRRLDPHSGDDLEFLAERRFLAPRRIWTRIDDDTTGTRSIECFDGESAWAQIGKEVHRLEGADYEVDRQRLKEDLAQTELLLDLFFLDQLRSKLDDLHRIDDVAGSGIKTYVLEGTTAVPQDADALVRRASSQASESTAQTEESRALVRLWIDQEHFHLMGARFEVQNSTEPAIQLCFWDWVRPEGGPAYPRTIKIFQGDEAQPRLFLYPIEVDFSPGLTEKDFLPAKQ